MNKIISSFFTNRSLTAVPPDDTNPPSEPRISPPPPAAAAVAAAGQSSRPSHFQQFVHSFFNDENIAQFTFFEDSNFLRSTSSRVNIEPQETSFRDEYLSPENLHSTTFDLFQRDKQRRSLLHNAVIQGNLDATRLLVIKGLNINAYDKDRRTPLHYAFMYYHQPIIRFLIQQPDIDLNATDYLRKTPLNTPFDVNSFLHRQDFNQAEYINIILSMVKKGADLLISDISNHTALDTISSNDSIDELFLTGILSDLLWFEYLPRMKSPLRLMNKLLQYDEKTILSLEEFHPSLFSKLKISSSPRGGGGGGGFFSTSSSSSSTTGGGGRGGGGGETQPIKQSCYYLLIERLFKLQDVNILYYLICLQSNLELSALLHVTESDELSFYSNKITSMIFEIFRCDSMEFPLNVQKILQPKHPINLNEPLLLIQAKSFYSENVLSYALERNSKILFSIPPIADYIDDLFFSSIRKECVLLHQDFQTPSSTRLDSNNTFHELRLLAMNLRSCPFAAFALRFISKSILLALITYVAVGYSNEFNIDFGPGNTRTTWSLSEVWLIIFTILEVMYEFGELIEDGFQFKRYMHRHRNVMELVSLLGITLWSLIRIQSNGINLARIILSLIAIPQTVSLLGYFSLYKPLGELILTLQFVFLEDILTFAGLYIVFVVAFGITIFVLFHDNALFPTSGLMFLQLFESTLQQFTFAIFHTNSIAVNTIGIVILILFLVLSMVILVNLLIARLSNTHQRVMEKAVIEWSFAKSQLVAKFLLLSEVHPLKIISPPFNILPLVCLPLHYYYLLTSSNGQSSKAAGISVVGTIANIEYSFFLGIFIRLYGLLQFYCYHILQKIKQTINWTILRDRRHLKRMSHFWFLMFPISLGILFLRIVLVALMPLIQWKENIEKIDIKGNFQYLNLMRNNTNNENTTENNDIDGGDVGAGMSGRSARGGLNGSRSVDDEEGRQQTGFRMNQKQSVIIPVTSTVMTSSSPRSLKENDQTKEAEEVNSAPVKINETLLTSRRSSVMSTKRHVRTTLLAIDAFSNRKNTIHERLYSEEDINRILSWISAENMIYVPNLRTPSMNGGGGGGGGGNNFGGNGGGYGGNNYYNNRVEQARRASASNIGPLAAAAAVAPSSLTGRGNYYREEDANLHYRQLVAKLDHLEEIIEEMQEKVDSFEKK